MELHHEDILPVLPWIIQPPSAWLENAVFFWEPCKRGGCTFSTRRLNACCLFLYVASVHSTASVSSSVSCLNSWQSCLPVPTLNSLPFPPHIHSSNSVQCATYTLSLHEKPLCQVCLPARSFSEHLDGWTCWLGRLKTTRKVDDENCRRSAEVAGLAGLSAQ